MSKIHLLSNSLYGELFRHNLVSGKGYVIANDEELEKYHNFLVQQAKDKTNDVYKKRNAMVKEVELLLKEDNLNKSEAKKLEKLLQNLNFEISDTGLLVSKEPDEIKLRYLGPSEPNQTFWERQIVADEKRMKMLKQDLRVLNKWLDEMSEPSYKILRFAPSTLFEQKKLREKHYKERTRRRLEKMSEARRRFINTYHKNYEKSLSSVLCPTSQKYLNKTLLITNNESPGKNTASSYYTAASDFSQIESDIQTEGSDFENNHGNKDYFHQDASHIKKDNEDSFYQSPSSQKNLNNDDSPEQAND